MNSKKAGSLHNQNSDGRHTQNHRNKINIIIELIELQKQTTSLIN